MNDYQMTKLSHGHIHELREEAGRNRLAAMAARRPSLARRLIDRILAVASDADEQHTADWAASLHRHDAWQERPNHR